MEYTPALIVTMLFFIMLVLAVVFKSANLSSIIFHPRTSARFFTFFFATSYVYLFIAFQFELFTKYPYFALFLLIGVISGYYFGWKKKK